jgi:hypothetical protein
LKGRLNPRVLAVLLGVAAIPVIAIAGSSAVAADPVQLLPDLAQEPPRDVVVKRKAEKVKHHGKTVKRSIVRLAFTSQVDNVGDGPLLVDGSRSSTASKSMQANQRIMSSDGTSTTVPNIGSWKYAVDKDHQHWHFQRFDVFSILNKAGKRVAKSGKQGFCLGDRGKGFTFNMVGQPAPKYVEHCDLNKPKALATFGGITPGWGDDYAAFLEGQSIDITKVKSGTYCLEHRTTSAFTEKSRDNNVAVAIVKVNTKAKKPTVKVLGTLSIVETPAPNCAAAFTALG